MTCQEMSAEERSKYTAVKADVPGLYMPASDSNLEVASKEEEPVFGAAEAAPGATGSDAAADEKNPPAAKNPDSAPTRGPARRGHRRNRRDRPFVNYF